MLQPETGSPFNLLPIQNLLHSRQY
jgi:hypothetical protein